jgi:hypothetical protein
MGRFTEYMGYVFGVFGFVAGAACIAALFDRKTVKLIVTGVLSVLLFLGAYQLRRYYCQIEVYSNVAGAGVWFDGLYHGSCPYRIEFARASSRHQLKVSATGYIEDVRDIDETDQSLRIILRPSPSDAAVVERQDASLPDVPAPPDVAVGSAAGSSADEDVLVPINSHRPHDHHPPDPSELNPGASGQGGECQLPHARTEAGPESRCRVVGCEDLYVDQNGRDEDGCESRRTPPQIAEVERLLGEQRGAATVNPTGEDDANFLNLARRAHHHGSETQICRYLMQFYSEFAHDATPEQCRVAQQLLAACHQDQIEGTSLTLSRVHSRIRERCH